MAGRGMVDGFHIASSFPVLKPNCRPHCSSGQVFASCNAISFFYQSYQFVNLQNSRFRDKIDRKEVAARLQCSRTRCRAFGSWSAQRGRVNHDRITSRDEGLGVRNDWPASGQCCIVSNFCQQVPRSRSSRVKRNIKVTCEGESASTYGFGNDTVSYREPGEALGQGGDGAERESVSPILLENSLTNNSVDGGYQSLRVNEGLFENSNHRTYELLYEGRLEC